MKRIYLFVYLNLLFLNNLFSQSNNSFRFLNETLSEHNRSVNRLSLGKLLWTDSPSSRAIYENLESHVNFLSMNIRNNQDLISYYNSKDGYLETISETLQRIRILILKRSNSFYNADDKEIIDSEIFILYSGILKELSWAQFNTVLMFSNWIENEDIKQRFKEPNFYTLEGIDRIIQAVISERSRIGTIINTLTQRGIGFAKEQENTKSIQANGDTDFNRELLNLKRNEIMFFSNIFLLRQK